MSSTKTTMTSAEYLGTIKCEEMSNPITPMQHYIIEALLFYILKDRRTDFDDCQRDVLVQELQKMFDEIVDMIDELPDDVKVGRLTISHLEHWITKRKVKSSILKGLSDSLIGE